MPGSTAQGAHLVNAADRAAQPGIPFLDRDGLRYLLDYADATTTRSSIAAYQDPRNGWAFAATGFEHVATGPAIGSWIAAGTPTVTTGVADPSGGTGAVTVEDDDAGGFEGHHWNSWAGSYTGIPYKVEISIKKGSAEARLYPATDGNVRFDTATGAVVSSSITGSVGVVEHPADSGWWLVTLHHTTGAGAGRVIVYCGGASTDTATITWWPEGVQVYRSLAYKTADEPRIFADGAVLVEGERANLLDYSADFTQWTTTGTSSVDSNVAEAPDGSTTADRLNIGTGDGVNLTTPAAGVTDNASVVGSVWLWTESGTDVARLQIRKKDGTVDTHPDITVTTTPTRYTFTVSDVLTGVSDPYLSIIDGSVGGGGGDGATVLAFGAQLEEGSWATSYIPTAGGTETRASDDISFSVDATLEAALEGGFSIDVWSLFGDADYDPDGPNATVFDVNAAWFRLFRDGNPGDTFKLQGGDPVAHQVDPTDVPFSALDHQRFTIHAPDGGTWSMKVENLDTAVTEEADSGGAITGQTLNGQTLHIGNYQSGSYYFHSVISRPRAA